MLLHHPGGVEFCLRPVDMPLTLATSGVVYANVFRLDEDDIPEYVEASWPRALRGDRYALRQRGAGRSRAEGDLLAPRELPRSHSQANIRP
jgi:hypothetical protein